MKHFLPAAAIPVGAMVRIPEDIPSAQESFIITRIDNGTPRPGLLVWEDEDGLEVAVPGARKIEVVIFP